MTKLNFANCFKDTVISNQTKEGYAFKIKLK